MRKIIVFGLLMGALVACDKKEEALPESTAKSASVAYRQETSVEASGLSLKIDLREVNDSRCPINADCIQMGSVILNFSVSNGTDQEDVSVHFVDGDKNKGSSKFSIGGQNYLLKVSQVLPYPQIAQKPVLTDYNVKVTIEKI